MGKFSAKKFEKREKENTARKKRNKSKSSGKFVRRLTSAGGANLFRFQETTSKGDFPWSEMGIHYSCGEDGKTQIRCLRDHADDFDKKNFQPAKKCPQCLQNEKDLKSGVKRKKIRASKRRRVSRIFLEGICLTPLIKWIDAGKKLPKLKKCFGTFEWRDDGERFDECETCSTKTAWGKVCLAGIGIFGVGPTLGDPLTSMAKKIGRSLKHNPFDHEEGHNFEFTKSGEEYYEGRCKCKTTAGRLG